MNLPAALGEAGALRERVLERAPAIEAQRHLDHDIAAAFAAAGLNRMAVPRAQGGLELPPTEQIQILEEVSRWDGATGWNLMIGAETFGMMVAAFPEADSYFARKDLITCGATSAIGTLTPAGDDYHLSGRWAFVSGCHNADVFVGSARLAGAGGPPTYALVDMAQVEILDTWYTNGLRGSGSHDIEITDVSLPAANVATQFGQVDSPLMLIPTGTRLAYNKTGVALGIARAALEEFVDLALGKTPRFTSRKLRERPSAQDALARAEALVRSARAFVLDEANQIWEAVSAGEPLTDERRALLQIACSNAAEAAVNAVDLIENAAGTSANLTGSRFERACRDVRVVRQHLTVASHNFTDAGRVLLGLPPEGLMLSLPR